MIQDKLKQQDKVSVALETAQEVEQTYILKIDHGYETKVQLGNLTMDEVQPLIDKYMAIWVTDKNNEFRLTITKEKK